MSKPAIFISYRRDDSQSQAGRLSDYLVKEFGKDRVFLDNDTLKPGDKWPEKLKNAVNSAQIVLVLIANKTRWLGVGDEGRRIDDDDDWVRLEVEAALSDSGKLVIPLVFNGAEMPSSRALPESLRSLAGLQKFDINEKQWNRDVGPLRDFIGKQLEYDVASAGITETPSAPGITPLTCDREEQYDVFEFTREKTPGNQPRFYYLYGYEMQGHVSFFKRLAYELSSKPEQDDTFSRKVTAIDFVVTSEGSSMRPDSLRTEFVRDLCTALGPSPDGFKSLTDKNLLELLRASQKTKDLTGKDYLLVFAHISHWYWNSVQTPAAALWFIENFCPRDLPPDCPEIFFFFSFDFNEEINPGVQEEVERIVKTEAKYVKPLPELGMVAKKHVAQWLVSHQKLISTAVRNQILAKSFTKEEYFMDDVTNDLNTIINQHFNRHIQ